MGSHAAGIHQEEKDAARARAKTVCHAAVLAGAVAGVSVALPDVTVTKLVAAGSGMLTGIWGYECWALTDIADDPPDPHFRAVVRPTIPRIPPFPLTPAK